ncbi:MAG TPA: GatB/YqeY domain-containing protein [Candidatus Dormibacteraeota bacterium]|nr:GatB/YqeY domain-containing protein [Candidatus Dormibacteraeota bacterium]
MAALKDRLSSELKDAMKARDQMRLDTLRSALSGFTYKRTEAGKDLTEDEELDVVRRLVKQRNDSLAEFEKAGRTDLAEKERAERDILAAYLPQQKSAEEVRAIVKSILAELPADGRNQGAAMKAVMPKLKGLADGNLVRAIVTEELA